MAELTPIQVVGLLRAGSTAIRAELEALPDEVARWHPAQGEWCALECLGHIIEAEKRGFAGRIRHVLEADEPALPQWDQVRVERERNDCERDIPDLLNEFLRLREASVGLVASLRPEQLDRAGVHEKIGRLTVREVIQEWVHHDRAHLRQLLANTQAYVWLGMGAAQRFSDD